MNANQFIAAARNAVVLARSGDLALVEADVLKTLTGGDYRRSAVLVDEEGIVLSPATLADFDAELAKRADDAAYLSAPLSQIEDES